MHVLIFALSGWFDRRARRKEAILADADRLIASFKDQAYFEARDRVKGRCVDGVESRTYWTKVKLEIAARQGVAIGLAGADVRA